MLLDELLSRLDGVKRSGEAGFVARCPAHEDHKQSLSVGSGDDERLLVTCFAGCDTESICESLGITLGDLFQPKSGGNGSRKIAATYDYTDELGELLFQVVRFEPKDFRQRRPNGGGGWEWKLGNTRRVLYRLPAVLAAVQADKPVYVVEGEKDADALAELGLAATCNPAGAGKWRDEYTTALTGAKVIIVADKDEPGRKHAFAVAASLAGRAADISIVEAAEGKDASDHLDAGYTPSEFVICRGGQDASTSSGLPAVTLADLIDTAPERPDYVWWGYLAKGAVSELAAKPKVGKTRLALEIVGRVIAGEDLLDHATFKCPVLYMTEQGRSSFVTQARKAKVRATRELHVLLRASVRSLQWDQVGELAAAYVAQHDIGLVVVDTLSDWAGMRGDDENSAGAALAAMQPLRALAESGCAVLAVRHEGKGTTRDVGEAARGSSAFAGAMDILMSLRRTKGRGHETRRELHAVGRFDDTPAVMTVDYDLELSEYHVIMEGADARKREVELQILEVLPMSEQWALSEADLRERLDLGHSTLSRALSDLVARSVICAGKRARSDGKGQTAVFWREEA